MPATPVTWLSDFLANTKLVDFQVDPAITQLANGNVLISWTDFDNTAGSAGSPAGRDVIGRIFDPLGTPITGEFRLNTFAVVDSEEDAEITALADGGFMVVYEDNGSDNDLIYEVFASGGQQQKASFLFDDGIGGAVPNSPVVASASATSVMTAYIVDYADGSKAVFARGYNPTADSFQPPSVKATSSTSLFDTIRGVSVTEMLNGDFALALSRRNAGVETFQITTLDASANTISSMTINPNAIIGTIQCVGLTGGNIALTYENLNTGAINAWVFGSGLNVVSGPIVVGPIFGNQIKPDVAALADGGFVIVWDDNASSDIRGQRFAANGALVGNEFVIDTTGNQFEPRVVGFADGRFQVTWIEDGDIRSKIYDPRDTINSGVYSPDQKQIGTVGADVFTADGVSEFVYGGDGDDIITESGQIRQYFGGEGNDTLRVTSSINSDLHDGGNGFDTIDWRALGQTGVQFDLEAGKATELPADGGQIEEMLNFETLIGTNNQDFIFGTNGGNVFQGRGGDDLINGRGGIDRADYEFVSAPAGFGVVWGSGNAANFQFRTSLHGTDTLQNIEVLLLDNTSGAGDIVLDTAVATQYLAGAQLGINAFGSGAAGGGWASNDLYLRRMGDVNGDGRADIIGFGSDFTYVSLGQVNGTFANPIVGINSFGSGIAGGGWVSNNVYLRQIGDVNGDGRADIVGFGSDYTYVSLGQANGTFANPIIGINSFGASVAAGGWTNNNLYGRELGDVNGDGRADIVGFGSDFTFVSLGQANGTFANPIIGIAGFGLSPAGGGWASQNQYPRMMGDVNGDNRADIVGFGSTGTYVSLGQANGTFGATTQVTDAFGAGTGWPSQDTHPRVMADLNNDGRDDIIGFGPSGVYGALALPGGTGFTTAPLMTTGFGSVGSPGFWESQNTHPRLAADVDGDGRADIVGFSSTGAFTAINTTDYFVI